jgi:hypothetical protein
MKTQKPKQYRQGDVLIEEIAETETKHEWKRSPKIVLAEGEATGHAHCLECDDADAWKEGERFEVRVNSESASVTHEEHAKISLPRGRYRVTRQREYKPEAVHNVAD